MSKNYKKLGTDSNYKKPKVTYQDQLTVEEIKEKLQGYIRVDDLEEVPIDTHLRYFVKDESGEKFRLGGFLKNKRECHKYVMLSNGTDCWPVQVKNAIFYRKMSHSEEINYLELKYLNKIAKMEEVIHNLSKKLTKLGYEVSIEIDSDEDEIISVHKETIKNNKKDNKREVKERGNKRERKEKEKKREIKEREKKREKKKEVKIHDNKKEHTRKRSNKIEKFKETPQFELVE